MSLRESRLSDEDGTDLAEHLEQVKEIFDSIDPTGKKGLNYTQFKAVLVNILKVELDESDPEQFDGILEELDPDETGFVRFERLEK